MNKNSILPIDNHSFISDIDSLFSLSNEQIMLLFELLEKKKDIFSTKHVMDTLEINSEHAIPLRKVMIYLLHLIRSHDDKVSILKKELMSTKLSKPKLDFFFNQIKKMNSKSTEIINDLYAAIGYTAVSTTLGTYGIEINHTFLKRDLKKMIPFVLFKISSADTKNSFKLQMDADSFEIFVNDMDRLLSYVKTESQNLKETLGDKYIRVIGD